MLQTISLLPPKNERHRSVINFGHRIIENPGDFAATLTHNRTIAHLSRENMVVTTSVQCPKHECQQSVNDFWPCIMENTRIVRRHCAIVELPAAFLYENGCDNIASMS